MQSLVNPLPTFRLISKETYKSTPWKNGRGQTQEIAIYPEGSTLQGGDFLWRLSTARVEQDSAFSLFPDYDRTLVVTKGNGARLLREDSSLPTVLGPLVPYTFSGEVAVHCELPGGSIQDLGLFTKKSKALANCEVIEVSASAPRELALQGRWNLLFAVKGMFEFRDTHLKLSPGDTLLVESSDGDPSNPLQISTEATGALIYFSIQINNARQQS